MTKFIKRFFPMLPESYEHQQKLNSYEPAMTQLSRMCLSATVSQYARHNRLNALILAYGEDGAADYLWSHYAYAMNHFLTYKVGPQSTYNRKYNFFTNVLSSVRSVQHYTDYRYKRRYGVGIASLNDIIGHEGSNVEWMATLSSKDKPVPLSYKNRRKRDDELMTVLEDQEEMQCGFYS